MSRNNRICCGIYTYTCGKNLEVILFLLLKYTYWKELRHYQTIYLVIGETVANNITLAVSHFVWNRKLDSTVLHIFFICVVVDKSDG